MTEEDVKQLKIGDMVEVKVDKDNIIKSAVVCINNHTKRIGVYYIWNLYLEFPYRLVSIYKV